jgi:heptaprenyl diphosphate synthase
MTFSCQLNELQRNGQSDTSRTARLALVSVLIAAAAALQIIESPLPRFLPWLKPGIANALTLYALVRLSVRAGFLIAILRTAIAAIFLGSFLSPVHLISLAGATGAAAAMAIFRTLLPRSGLAIVSVAGAIASNSAQLWLVQMMFAGNIALWFHVAIMIWIAVPSGLIVAKITQELLRRTV